MRIVSRGRGRMLDSGASGKNVVWTVFPFAPQLFIRGKRTHVVGLPTHLRTTDSLLPSVSFSQRLKSTAKYVEPVTLLLVYLG
jgi:hypothetical protein